MRIINTKSIRTISVVVALLIGIIYNSIDVYAETEATLKSKLQAATSSQIRDFKNGNKSWNHSQEYYFLR